MDDKCFFRDTKKKKKKDIFFPLFHVVTKKRMNRMGRFDRDDVSSCYNIHFRLPLIIQNYNILRGNAHGCVSYVKTLSATDERTDLNE